MLLLALLADEPPDDEALDELEAELLDDAELVLVRPDVDEFDGVDVMPELAAADDD